MKHHLLTLLGGILLVFWIAPAAFAQTESHVSADALMTRFAEAWSSDDTTAVSRMFAEDVVLVDNGTNYAGREAVDAWRRPDMGNTDVLTVHPIRSRSGCDLAFQQGRWSLTYEGGTATGNHTFVFARGEDGTWRIAAMDIENDPRP